MPIFSINGKDYNVREADVAKLAVEHPDAFTVGERDGAKFRVSAKDYPMFMSPSGTTFAPTASHAPEDFLDADLRDPAQVEQKQLEEREAEFKRDINRFGVDNIPSTQQPQQPAPVEQPQKTSLASLVPGPMGTINSLYRSGANTPTPEAEQPTIDDTDVYGEEVDTTDYAVGFGEGTKEGWKGLVAGTQYFGGELANAITGTSRDDWQALQELQRRYYEGESLMRDEVPGWKKAWMKYVNFNSLIPESAKKSYRQILESDNINSLINDALEAANGDVTQARKILAEQSLKETWGDRQIEAAGEKLETIRPTKGFGAWAGNLIPQMIPTAAALAAGFLTKNPKVAQTIGQFGMGVMTASTAGMSMKEARDAGATNGEVWAAGIADGVIEYVSEKIPFDIYTRKIAKNMATSTSSDIIRLLGDPKSPAKDELEKLVVETNKRLGGKLLSGRNVKEYLTSVAAEGLSEFSAEALQTMTPIIYEEPENYPTLWDALKNGFEGFKAGIFMGAIMGGGSKAMEHQQQRSRRKQQGYVAVAQIDTDNGSAIGEVVGDKDGKIIALVDGDFIEVAPENVGTVYEVPFEAFDKGVGEYEIEESYENGYTLQTPQEKNDAMTMKEEQRKRVIEIMHLPEDTDLDEYLGDDPLRTILMMEEGTTQGERQALLDYVNAASTVEGMFQAVRDDIDGKIAQSDAQVDSRISKTDGRIHPATMKQDNRAVYIMAGDVVLLDDGTIDTANSSESIIVKDAETGKMEFSNPASLLNVGEVEDAEQTKEALREQIRQSVAGQAEAEILGTLAFAQGDTYVLTDEEGVQHQAQIVADNGDGTVQVALDGATEAVQMPKEQVQAMNDATNRGRAAAYIEQQNAQRESAMQEVAEEQQPIEEQTIEQPQEPQVEESALSRIPTDENGNQLFEQAPAQDTWSALVELNEGDTTEATDTAQQMLDNAKKELNKATSVKPKGGATVAEIQQDKAERKARIAEAQQKVDYWTEVLNAQQAVQEQSAQEVAQAEEVEETIAQEPNTGIPQTKLNNKEIDAIVSSMEQNAAIAPEIELTPENWVAEFGEDGVIETPIGEVKMGENQYFKLAQKGRESKLGMIKPTLQAPDIIVEERSSAKDGQVAERNSSYVFVKAFTNADGTRTYKFTSVTIRKEGREVVISNQEKETPRIKRLLKEGMLTYISEATLPSEPTHSTQGDQQTIPSGATLSDSKDTTSEPNNQEVEQEISQEEQIAPQEVAEQTQPATEPTAQETQAEAVPVQEQTEQEEQKQRKQQRVRIKVKKDEEARRKPLRKRAQAWAKKVGVEAVLIERFEDVENESAHKAIQIHEEQKSGQRIPGWYSGGKVYIYLPHATDISDLDQTYIHEVVAHHGMKKMLGEEGYNQFCLKVWDMMEQTLTERELNRWLAYQGVKGDKAKAADEYIAHLAETTESLTELDQSVWDKIVELLRDALRQLGVSLEGDAVAFDPSVEFTNKLIVDALHASKRNLKQTAKTATTKEKAKTATPKAQKVSDPKIEDFGEKIGGARKDVARGRLRDTAKLSMKDLTTLKDPDKILSRKDIVKFMQEGLMTEQDAMTLMALNAAARSKWTVRKGQILQKYRDVALQWERGEQVKVEVTDAEIDAYLAGMNESWRSQPNARKKAQADLLHSILVPFEAYHSTYEKLNYPSVYRNLKGTVIKEYHSGKYFVQSELGARRGMVFNSLQQAIDYVEKAYPVVSMELSKPKSGKADSSEKVGHLHVVKDSLYGYRIKSRSIPGNIFLSGRFKTKAEAEAYLQENAETLRSREEQMIFTLMGSDIGAVERSGVDYRQGRDITPEEFQSTFGFRGVEFGNWVPQAERQLYLNKTYDAIMDFCKVVGISPKAFSLGGQLALAFGSRGKSKAIAHYEPMKMAINLTRMNGAGSLAHEWFHALDNYLARQATGNALDMATDKRRAERDIVANTFSQLVRRMATLDYSTRSRNAGAYWNEVWERAARLFETYVYNELGGQQTISPLLVRETTLFDDTLVEDFGQAYPYPSAEENAIMKPYFDALFGALEERTDEQGNSILFRTVENDKARQFAIIERSNPMLDDYHTGIRSVEDIRTFDEAVAEARAAAEQGGWEELASYPDITNDMLEEAQQSGRITIYSSKPIANGTFVTPSLMQASDYAGGEEVYSKVVRTSDVAWINTDEGQMAASEDVRFRTTYHGTPAIFERFDHSFMGSGEGNQAFGWGTYVTEEKGIGEWYAKVLTAPINEFIPERRAIIDAQIELDKAEQFADSIREEIQSANDNIAFFEERIRNGATGYELEEAQENIENSKENISYNEQALTNAEAKIEGARAAVAQAQEVYERARVRGNVYQVEIPDDNGHNYLSWEGRLTPKQMQMIASQAEKEGLTDIFYRDEDSDELVFNGSITSGEREYKDLVRSLGSDKAASEFLSRAGFTGIKYFGDGGNQDVHNYVIFNDADLEIKDRTSFRTVPTFLSNAAVALEGIKQEKATPQQWLAMLKKAGGIKAGEDKWIGLSEWLEQSEAKTLTKQEVADFINENQIQIEEVAYNNGKLVNRVGELTSELEYIDGSIILFSEAIENDKQYLKRLTDEKRKFDEKGEVLKQEYGEDSPEYQNHIFYDSYTESIENLKARIAYDERRYQIKSERADAIRSELEDLKAKVGDERAIDKTRLEYTTDGLDNKREIALTVPTIESWNEADDIHFGDAGDGRAIAWIRFGETTDSDGKRVLVIDEIQSQRHQEGREKGYRPSDVDKYLKDNNVEVVETGEFYEFYRDGELDRRFSKGLLHYNIKEAKNLYVAGYEKSNIPEAPFEKNWAELAMKRMLRYAAEHGFDKVAWTKGDQQAERYDIGSVVDKIVSYTEAEAKTVRIYLKNNEPLNLKVDSEGKILYSNRLTVSAGQNLSDVVGKDAALKILRGDGEDATIYAGKGKEYAAKQLSGNNLRIGGEGMRAFYDQMLPSFMRKYAKKWGATVQDVTLPNVEEAGRTMHSVDVTDSMRESVMQGQTMFRVSKSPEEFDSTQKEAVAKNGIVSAGLNNASLAITDVPNHDFSGTGKVAIKKAQEWAEEHIVGRHTYHQDQDDAFEYTIDGNAIGKFLSGSSTGNSSNLGVHLAVLKELPRVIGNSIEVEIHPDYRKIDGVRSASNGVDRTDLLVHRLYGAVRIGDKIYRAKTTIHEYRDKDNRAYDYKITEVELVISGSSTSNALKNSTSVTAAKILQGIEKSYDAGKKILDESKKNAETDSAADPNRYMFIGEQGARQLDAVEEATTRLDNLEVAKEMEAANKGPRTIKMATGWERGADGKWRYETLDGIDTRAIANITEGEYTLEDFVSDESLFDAYPSLRGVKVIVEPNTGQDYGGYWDSANNTIALVNYNDSGKYEQSSIIHEIQHAIQRKEGFTSGINPKSEMPISEEKRSQIEALRSAISYTQHFGDVNLASLIHDDKKYGGYIWNTLSQETKDILTQLAYGRKKMSPQEAYIVLNARWDKLIQKELVGEGRYRRQAGEVEARNSAARRGMGLEERRAFLASETEDVAREDQLFIYDNIGSKNTIGQTAQMLGQDLATRVNLVERIDDITDPNPKIQERKRKARGWYDTESGEVFVVLPNVKSGQEARRTVFHEVVGHKGMRETVGEKRYNAFLEKVYRGASPAIRERIARRAATLGWDFNLATDEYLASLAEQGFEERENRNFFEVVRDLFLDLLSDAKIALGYRINDNDIRYMLWRTYQMQRSKGAMGIAEDVVMQQRLGVGEFDTNFRVASEREQIVEKAKVDGTYLKAPNGKPTNLTPEQWVTVRTKAFKRWFGDWENDPENASKVVDENGEPKVVYHQTNAKVYINRETGQNWDELDWRERMEWDERDDWDDYWIEQDFTKFSRVNARVTQEFDGFFFAPEYDEFHEYGDRTIAAFLNIRKPASREDYNIDSTQTNAGREERLRLQSEGFDGVIREYEGAIDEYVAFYPNQIKLADGSNTTFDPSDDVRMRVAHTPYRETLIRQQYEERIKSGMYQSMEAMQDSMQSLHDTMLMILKEEGYGDMYIEDVASFENAYIGENRLSSTNLAEANAFANTVFQRLVDAISAIAPNEEARTELIDYMFAKHGLERNEKMAEREAKREYDQQESRIASKAISASGAKTMAELIAEKRQKDYAGLTALTGKKHVSDAEKEAQRMVEEYENSHETAEIWERVQEVRKAILSKLYEGGLMSEDQMEQILDMYDYYIPLRGFDEKTVTDQYAYLTSTGGSFSSPIRKAGGRESKADDPFANLSAMAESAILQANRNMLIKQRFLNFVLRHPSDLVSVNRLWLRYDETNQEWVPEMPNILETDSPDEVARKVAEHEQAMKELSKANPDRYKVSGDQTSMPYKVPSKETLKEHQVIVKRNGVDYVLTINGSPRLAQALNGLTNPDNDISGAIGAVLDAAQWVNRALSAAYTTRNPDFLLSNFMRDMLYTNTMVWVKESPNYALAFHKNYLKANPAQMKILYSKYNEGTLDMSDPMEAMFYKFIINGGETGYVNLKDVEQHKSELKEKLARSGGKLSVKEGLQILGDRLDGVNQAVENCARFAAFMTSQQMGRSVDRSIYDAKEISVNFNKKGAGSKFMGANGQTALGNTAAFTSGLGRAMYVFWNAAIQGTANFGRQVKRHPAKAFTAVASWFVLGALMAYLGYDDDDEDAKNSYFNNPEYVRRSNIMFHLGDSHYAKIPLPIEARAAYGLGELMVSVMSGKEDYSDGELASAIVGQMTQILPLDFMEGQGGFHAFIPSSVKPVTEIVSNTSWTGLPIYKDTPYNKDMPNWTKAYSGTNKYLVNLAATLNELSGGDKYTKGAIDLNPANIEYLLNGYFGGYFATADKLTKTAEMVVGARDFDPRGVLFLNRVLAKSDDRTQYRAVNNKYYEAKKEYETTKRRLRNYEHDTDEGIFNFAEKIDFLYNSEAYRRMELFDIYRGDIEDLEREIKEATSDEEKEALNAELMTLKSLTVDAIYGTEEEDDNDSR